MKVEEIIKDVNMIFKNSRYLAVSETSNILDCKSVTRIWKVLYLVLYTTWIDSYQ